MKLILITLFILSSRIISAQEYLAANERVIFSFETLKGKQLFIAADTAEAYIVYRYGTKDKIELEFPDNKEMSWAQFNYSFYMRGGGAENEGLDLNYFYFTIGDYQYVVYSEDYTPDNSTNCGIKVINLKTQKTTNIKGDSKTINGTLLQFRDHEKIITTDKLFE